MGTAPHHELTNGTPGMLTQPLERLYDWLSPADNPGQGDVMFVLAGRQSRKVYALELFRRGAAGTLLISVARFEIRKFAQLSVPADLDLQAIARATPPSLRHYFVSFQEDSSEVALVSRGRFGTLSEIQALARWLQARPQIRILLVVSSAPHLRRVRACCRALLPTGLKIHFVATSNDGALMRSNWWRNRHSMAVVLKEIPKLFIYKLLLWSLR